MQKIHHEKIAENSPSTNGKDFITKNRRRTYTDGENARK